MGSICYMVIATLPTPEMAEEYVAWLEDGHVDQVIRAGAHSGMIVRLEPPGGSKLERQVMTQYIFGTREMFDQYVRMHAPKLREEGLRRFPPETDVKMERRVGVVA